MCTVENIPKYLGKLNNEIEAMTAGRDNLCSVSGLDYSGQSLPDYQDHLVQKVHNGRYAYSYYHVYRGMMGAAFSFLGKREEYRVLSVGCGSCIDLLAARSVTEARVNYQGVDPVSWSDRASGTQGIPLIQALSRAADYFSQDWIFSYDVLSFPMSFSEMGEQDLNAFLRALGSRMGADRFALAMALRTNRMTWDEDMRRLGLVVDAASVGGFRYSFLAESPDERGAYVCRQEQDYQYPKDLIRLLGNLNEHCHCAAGCPWQQTCAARMNRYPMLRTGYVKYVVMGFERD